MALNKSPLKADLESLFTAPPATVAACADAWAAAYASYAANAKSCSTPGTPASLAPNQTVLSAALLAAFSGTDPSATASAIATALTTFWLLPPVVFSGTTPGVVSLVAGTAALQAGLISMWASNVADAVSAAQAAQNHADVFDIFTKTVVVTHAPPSACASPIA